MFFGRRATGVLSPASVAVHYERRATTWDKDAGDSSHSVSDPIRFPPERSLRSAVKTWSDSDESDDAEAALGDDSERLWNFDLPQVGRGITGLGLKVVPRLRECCSQSQAEVVSNSRNIIHKTWS